MRVALGWEGVSVGVTNVHLDWQRAASREGHIVRIVRELVSPVRGDYDVLCVDFNDDDGSPIMRFLDGKSAIEGHLTRWHDLVHKACAAQGKAAPPTLNFANNPRWARQGRNDPPARFDRIYLRASEKSAGLHLVDSGLFGHVAVNRFGIVPSDHCGVSVDLGTGV